MEDEGIVHSPYNNNKFYLQYVIHDPWANIYFQMYAIVGFVGDRTLTMKFVKSERPTLTIFKTLDVHNPNSKRSIITYKRHSKVFDEAANNIHMEWSDFTRYFMWHFLESEWSNTIGVSES